MKTFIYSLRCFFFLRCLLVPLSAFSLVGWPASFWKKQNPGPCRLILDSYRDIQGDEKVDSRPGGLDGGFSWVRWGLWQISNVLVARWVLSKAGARPLRYFYSYRVFVIQLIGRYTSIVEIGSKSR